MVKLRWSIAMSLALVALMIVVVALPAGSQQPQQRGTITLFDPNKTNYEKVIDEGRKGFSAGDTILFVDAQFDPETCERVGTLVGRLVISKRLKQDNAWFVGDFTLKLADGKVVAEAAARFAEFAQTEDGVFAVTGGTGAYRDASGEVLLQEDVAMCDRKGSLTTVDIGPQP
jgi:hypothetical protein